MSFRAYVKFLKLERQFYEALSQSPLLEEPSFTYEQFLSLAESLAPEV